MFSLRTVKVIWILGMFVGWGVSILVNYLDPNTPPILIGWIGMFFSFPLGTFFSLIVAQSGLFAGMKVELFSISVAWANMGLGGYIQWFLFAPWATRILVRTFTSKKDDRR